MRVRYLLVLIFLGIYFLTQCQTKYTIPLLDDDIGQSIFHQNKLYIVYVANYPNEDIKNMFQEQCEEEEMLCAILSAEVQTYQHFRQFLGIYSEEFFAVLDVQNRKKYVLEIDEQFTVEKIKKFIRQFQQGSLQPYFASQQSDDNNENERCRKIVGKNLDIFLTDPAQLKVLFLYTQNKVCQICVQMLQQYIKLSDKIYDKDIVIFGYFDLFRNDHPKITDQILPYFLIFTKESSQPYGLNAGQFDKLQQTIIQLALKNSDINLGQFRRQYMMNLSKDKQQKGEDISKDQSNNYLSDQL